MRLPWDEDDRLAFSYEISHNELLPTCGVPQAQRPFVSNHGGFCFIKA